MDSKHSASSSGPNPEIKVTKKIIINKSNLINDNVNNNSLNKTKIIIKKKLNTNVIEQLNTNVIEQSNTNVIEQSNTNESNPNPNNEIKKVDNEIKISNEKNIKTDDKKAKKTCKINDKYNYVFNKKQYDEDNNTELKVETNNDNIITKVIKKNYTVEYKIYQNNKYIKCIYENNYDNNSLYNRKYLPSDVDVHKHCIEKPVVRNRITQCENVLVNYSCGDEIYKWCGIHNPKEFDNYCKTSFCLHKGCKKKSSYYFEYITDNNEIKKSTIYCAEHAIPETELNGTMCQTCTELQKKGEVSHKHRATFKTCTDDLTDEELKITEIKFACAIHKTNDMFDFKNSKCIEITNGVQCTKLPSFGLIGTKLRTHCLLHKKSNEEQTTKTICKYTNCNTIASYGFEDRIRLYCAVHADSNHIDLAHYMCDYEGGCNIRPSFNLIGLKPRRCVKHKLENFVNVTVKLCTFNNCNSYALYGYEYLKPLFCYVHKNIDHINVLDKICEFKSCQKYAHYNYIGYTEKFCSIHKLPTMIVNPIKFCRFCDTSSVAKRYNATKICGLDECNKVIYSCDIHSKEYPNCTDIHKTCIQCYVNKIDIENTICKSCEKFNITNKTEETIRIEHRIGNFLEEKGITFYSHDSTIPDACNKYRPDFIIFANTGYIVLEIDEKQHKQYPKLCEEYRLQEITVALNAPCHFIRFNPDTYKTINNSKPLPLVDRLYILYNKIKEFKFNHSETSVEVLFFDEL
jgi:hypothetical protein